MKRIGTVVIGLGGIALISLFALNCKKKAGGPKAGAPRAVSPNGIAYPTGFKDWKVIGLSHREDNKTLRYILGNDVAVEAARSGKTNPWPDGAILGKVVWKQKTNDKWARAIGPGKLVHAEFMVKDAKKFASTGGWGYARWLGNEQKVFIKALPGAKKFTGKLCMNCHLPVKDNDYVFTRPASFPGSQKGVGPVPNGITIPMNYKDMRPLAVSRRLDNKTLRYILGNDIAVEAARSGKTNPWPKGSILAKMVWKEKSHPKWAKAIEPAKFVHAEFMIKDAKKYASTGGWGYARWKGLGQKPYAKRFNKEKKFSGKECMTCHLPVKGRDYVFTHAVNLP